LEADAAKTITSDAKRGKPLLIGASLGLVTRRRAALWRSLPDT